MTNRGAPRTRETRASHASHDRVDDGDIRYRPDIQGYPRDVRRRVRDTEHQVNLLVTSRIRDTNTAAEELAAPTISQRVRELVQVRKLVQTRQAEPGDETAAWVSLAATAIICAEHANRPVALGGTGIRPGLKRLPTPANVIPIRPLPNHQPPAPAARASRKRQPCPGQISLWGDVA